MLHGICNSLDFQFLHQWILQDSPRFRDSVSTNVLTVQGALQVRRGDDLNVMCQTDTQSKPHNLQRKRTFGSYLLSKRRRSLSKVGLIFRSKCVNMNNVKTLFENAFEHFQISILADIYAEDPNLLFLNRTLDLKKEKLPVRQINPDAA